MLEKKNSYLPVIFMILAVGMGIVFRGFWLEYVIHPAANLLWFGWQKIRSVAQLHYWIATVALCVAVGLLIFLPRKKRELRSAYAFDYLPPGRHEHWQELFQEAKLGNAGRENLRAALIQLITQVYRSRALSVEGKLNQSSPNFEHFSASTLSFLFPPPDRPQPMAAISDKISRRFKKTDQEEQRAIEEILSWIETEMEIQYETE